MTMTPVWVFDGVDDTDSTMVLDWCEEDQRLYLYSGCEVKNHPSRHRPNGKNPDHLGYIRKQCAATGEVLWYHNYKCALDRAVTGGTIATLVSGKAGSDISHLVIFKVSKTLNVGGGGVLVAVDKKSGEKVWEKILPSYGWSSPVGVYTEDGRGYIVHCDSVGDMRLIRGTTGETLRRINLGSNVEASPAVWGNMIVVGTRGQRIIGIKLS
jgi:outer membrane protein assembly factor BamB